MCSCNKHQDNVQTVHHNDSSLTENTQNISIDTNESPHQSFQPEGSILQQCHTISTATTYVSPNSRDGIQHY